MNKVITIHLNGHAYQVEETGYEALRLYLDRAARQLDKNPDRVEIIADIEQAIAEKLLGYLSPNKTVILAAEVSAIISEMGPVQDDSLSDDPAQPPANTSRNLPPKFSENQSENHDRTNESDTPARRLYIIPEGAFIAGVCNGFAAYFGLDVVVVRLGFVVIAAACALLALLIHWFFFLPILAYAACALMLPTANTAAERAAARGDPATAEEYIRRAKQGYYASLNTLANSGSKKNWKRKMRQEMRDRAYDWRHNTSSTNGPTVSPILPLAVPFFGFIEFVLTGCFVFALILFIKNRELLGIGLPDGVPLWVGIVGICLVFHAAKTPLKALRWASYSRGCGQNYSRCHRSWFDSIAGLAALAASVWAADRYIPAAHDFFLTLPAHVDQAASSLKEWWSRR